MGSWLRSKNGMMFRMESVENVVARVNDLIDKLNLCDPHTYMTATVVHWLVIVRYQLMNGYMKYKYSDREEMKQKIIKFWSMVYDTRCQENFSEFEDKIISQIQLFLVLLVERMGDG